MRLTKKLLRDAADLIEPATDLTGPVDGERYMCHAVLHAHGGGWHSEEGQAAEAAFQRLLQQHGVSRHGDLMHDGVAHDPDGWNPTAQALRFDFLNLLAESL